MSKNFYSGVYQVENKDKYIGIKNPVYRSSWESRFCYFLDHNQNVLKWGYECLTIAYFSPLDNKMHKYYPDFVVELTDKTGVLKKFIVEVKPKSQTKIPKEPKNNNKKAQKRYLYEANTYVTNKCKWEAAEIYCQQHGMEFKLITEKDLFE